VSLNSSVLWIRDVYPGSRILICIHPGSGSNNSNERGIKYFLFLPYFDATIITIPGTQNYFFTGKEKYLSQFTKNYSPFTQKTKIWVQVSGKRPIPDPGVEKAPDTGSATLES
jgi:hypothetical protein